MIQWSKNFGYNIDLEKWQKLWTKTHKMTLATSYKENLHKMFYRWHMSPAKLAKMFPNVASKCWKCRNKEGTYYHMWWTCDRVKNYWEKKNSWMD